MRTVSALMAVLMMAPQLGWAADKGDLYVGEFDARSKEARAEIAGDLEDTVEALSAYVRHPTPKEYEWIERQRMLIQAATNDAKSHQELQLYRSTPLQLAKLRSLLDRIQSSLRCALTADQRNSEMACWATAALHLTDASTLRDAVQHLVREGEIPRKALALSLLGDTDGFAIDYMHYGRGILEYIVIPYMRACDAKNDVGNDN